MEIGLALPQFDYSVSGECPLRWETLLAWATNAEHLGFTSLWMTDHLFSDLTEYGGPPGDRQGFDPLVALGALARSTTTVRLGSLVMCTPPRAATVLAKSLATLDVISDGRLVIGLGTGSYEPEFTAAGVPFGSPVTRTAALADAVVVMRGMFGGGPFSFESAASTSAAVAARCLPLPVQRPNPPIWIATHRSLSSGPPQAGSRRQRAIEVGDGMLDVIARHGDGWTAAWSWAPEDYRPVLAALGAACDRTGRDPATVDRSVGLYALAGESERDLESRYRRLQQHSPAGVLHGIALGDWRRGRLVGTVDEVRAKLQEWRGLGVSTLVLNTGATPFAVGDPDDLTALAEVVKLEAS